MQTFPYYRYLDLLVVALLGTVVAWYLFDASSESAALGNLILIAPMSATGFLLLVYIVLRNTFGRAGLIRDKEKEQTGGLSQQLQMLALVGIYIFALEYFYFDVATTVFCFCLMMLIKRGNVAVAAAYAVLVSLLICFSFKALVPYYPFPMLLALS